MAKNIKDYVVGKVLENIAYRDEEIEKLKEVLEELKIRKCSSCERYKEYVEGCYFCEKLYCLKCSQQGYNRRICYSCLISEDDSYSE
jgi:predicted transcriptional regulator